jgi:hypothetical protein
MKFHATVRLWIEADSLKNAESALHEAADAAHKMLGPLAIADPEFGGLYGGSIEGLDEEAAAALAEGDAGPGRYWTRFQY